MEKLFPECFRCTVKGSKSDRDKAKGRGGGGGEAKEVSWRSWALAKVWRTRRSLVEEERQRVFQAWEDSFEGFWSILRLMKREVETTSGKQILCKNIWSWLILYFKIRILMFFFRSLGESERLVEKSTDSTDCVTDRFGRGWHSRGRKGEGRIGGCCSEEDLQIRIG